MPQNLDFNQVLLKYSTDTKKLEINLGDVYIEDTKRKVDVIFDQLSLEVDPFSVFTSKNSLCKISSDKFEIRIALADEDLQKLDSQLITRSSMLNMFEKFYIYSEFIYGKNINFKNGRLLYKRANSPEFSFGIHSVESSIKPEGYVLLASFDSISNLSTLALTFKQTKDQHLIESSIHGLNLTNIKNIFPQSQYRDSIIADGADTLLNADIVLDYNHDTELKEFDIELNIETPISSGSHQLKLLDFAAKIKDSIESVNISKFELVFGNNGRISTSLSSSFNQGGIFNKYSDLPSEVDIKQDYSDIEVEQLTYFIPEGRGHEFKEWMDESLNKGKIAKGYNNIKLNQDFFVDYTLPDNAIDCQLTLENAELNYYDEHPDLIIGIANIKVLNDHLLVSSSDVKTSNGLSINEVEAKVPFGMNNIEINGKGLGDVKSLVDFINKEDHQIIKREGLDFSNLSSKLGIDFSVLVKNTPVADIADVKFNINIKSLEAGKYIYDKDQYEIKDIDININADQKLVFQGSLVYENIPLSFIYDNSYKNTDGKLNAKVSVSNKVLQTTSFGKSLNIAKGDLLFKLQSLGNGGYGIACDATNNEIIFTKFEITKKENVKMLISGNLDSLNMTKFKLSNLLVQGDNINFKLDLIKNKNTLDINLRDGQFDNNKFNAHFIKSGANKKLYLDASYIDLSTSLEDIIDIEDEENDELGHFDYDVMIKKAKLKGNIYYQDLKIKLACGKGLCEQIEMSAMMSGGYFVKIGQPLPQHKEKLVISSNNTGILFRSLGIYTDLEGGELEVELIQSNQGLDGSGKEDFNISGRAHIYDFSTKNSSFLTKLVLGLTTLDGIGSIIGNKNLHFSDMVVDINYADSVVALKHGKLISSGLDITLDGDIDLKKKYVILNGNLIPSMYGINKIVSKVPLVGNLLSGGGGVIDAKYRVYGNFGDIKTSVNPLSILPLGFFKNLFK